MDILVSEIREREWLIYDDENKYEGFVLFLEQNKNMKRVMFGSVHWLDFIDKLMSASTNNNWIEWPNTDSLALFIYACFSLRFFFFNGIYGGGPRKKGGDRDNIRAIFDTTIN